MASLQQYAIANVLVNGSLLAEEMTVTAARDTKAQEIETVTKGLAGFSPGAARTTIDVESAVPSADFELNPGKYLSNIGIPQIVEFTIFAAGRTLTVRGWITNDNFAHGVGTPAKLKFTAICQYGDWA